jgi:hypothetical protein
MRTSAFGRASYFIRPHPVHRMDRRRPVRSGSVPVVDLKRYFLDERDKGMRRDRRLVRMDFGRNDYRLDRIGRLAGLTFVTHLDTSTGLWTNAEFASRADTNRLDL